MVLQILTSKKEENHNKACPSRAHIQLVSFNFQGHKLLSGIELNSNNINKYVEFHTNFPREVSMILKKYADQI